ncbi:amylo-alpha-1,6-glucosidase [Cesiribacter sp. SM1]|uniref:amylo-alpha-1,6-glucosidase n=1 Tax=Cesiribacter sp. SM1 TaxID=2861196 RepID=UPI001CD7EEA9|nr:trehalase-like protein [Cesiribacter sp. SM1]
MSNRNKAFPDSSPDQNAADQELFQRVRQLLHNNMIRGHRKENGSAFHYTKPSPGRYPFQFFWDTCFHVFIFSALGEHEMAKEHLYSLFALQEEDGFVGHMIYWDRLVPGRSTDVFQLKPGLGKRFFKEHMSALIQPPLVAQAVAKVFHNSGDRQFLQEMLPKLKKLFDWIALHRDFEGDGLITIISPFESGIDFKPTFDVALGMPQRKADWRLFVKYVGVDLRNFVYNYNLQKIYRKGYFLVKEVGFNTIYAQNLFALADLCSEADDPDAERYRSLGKKVVKSIIAVMYDEASAAFLDVYGKDNRKIHVVTPTVFFPAVLENMPETITQKVIDRHLFNSQEFDVPYPLPSVAKNHPSFNPGESMYIWRGPTWIFNNWFLHQFLIEKGHSGEATKLVESIRKLIESSGFREYYNPFTGEGYGAKDFTWAGLVVDMIQMEKRSSSDIPSPGF